MGARTVPAGAKPRGGARGSGLPVQQEAHVTFQVETDVRGG